MVRVKLPAREHPLYALHVSLTHQPLQEQLIGKAVVVALVLGLL